MQYLKYNNNNHILAVWEKCIEIYYIDNNNSESNLWYCLHAIKSLYERARGETVFIVYFLSIIEIKITLETSWLGKLQIFNLYFLLLFLVNFTFPRSTA